ACGYAFGSVVGGIIAVGGIMTGSALTLLLVRKFGQKFAELFYTKEKLESISILKDKRKRNALVFLVFFIPGTPKDLLTYVVGLTDMSIPMYLLLTGIARTPAILISTIGGDALGLENYVHGLSFLGGLVLVSGIGVLIYRKIHKKEE
ncbi:MAG: TVP38/TMEM64 family protein, partial [Lachnospiraceae bacterium]|nr:TVP38/TMEM64 family protein [Lachnospiraceae bacterium]